MKSVGHWVATVYIGGEHLEMSCSTYTYWPKVSRGPMVSPTMSNTPLDHLVTKGLDRAKVRMEGHRPVEYPQLRPVPGILPALRGPVPVQTVA